MQTRIRKARRSECAALTRIAHAARRFWGYPENLMREWKADLTVSPQTLAQGQAYCAVRDARVVGFYATSGEGNERELELPVVDTFQDGERRRPYFEMLLVTPAAAMRGERLIGEMRRLRRPEDAFIYEAVQVASFEDAINGLIANIPADAARN